MRDLRKDLRQYIELRQALGYKLRKHKPRLTEFLAFLEAKGADHITTKLAVAGRRSLRKAENTAALKGWASSDRLPNM